jgi:hypothetical protein
MTYQTEPDALELVRDLFATSATWMALGAAGRFWLEEYGAVPDHTAAYALAYVSSPDLERQDDGNFAGMVDVSVDLHWPKGTGTAAVERLAALTTIARVRAECLSSATRQVQGVGTDLPIELEASSGEAGWWVATLTFRLLAVEGA